MPDEYDAAQERGEVVGAHDGARKRVPDENAIAPATASDLGLSRKDIHEARQLRDAEREDPGWLTTGIGAHIAKALPAPIRAERLNGSDRIGYTLIYIRTDPRRRSSPMHHSETLRIPGTTVLQFEVDAQMRDLIEICWRRELTTTACCQGQAQGKGEKREHIHRKIPDKVMQMGSLAYIAFASVPLANLFVAWAGPHTWREGAMRAAYQRRQSGEYISPFYDWSIEAHIIRFPNEHIRYATEALKKRRWVASDWLRDEWLRTRLPKKPVDAPRFCIGCGHIIPPRRRSDAVYCSRKCQLSARDRSAKD